jgi:NAD(P) transhydrogenase
VAYDYDLLVIGSGPAGQKAAIQAAKLGRRVALVERGHMVGGVCTNTGTIPSKTLREAVIYLTGMSQRGIYGQSYRAQARHSTTCLANRACDQPGGCSKPAGPQPHHDDHGQRPVRRPAPGGGDGESGEARIVRRPRSWIAVGTHPARLSTVESTAARPLT